MALNEGFAQSADCATRASLYPGRQPRRSIPRRHGGLVTQRRPSLADLLVRRCKDQRSRRPRVSAHPCGTAQHTLAALRVGSASARSRLGWPCRRCGEPWRRSATSGTKSRRRTRGRVRRAQRALAAALALRPRDLFRTGLGGAAAHSQPSPGDAARQDEIRDQHRGLGNVLPQRDQRPHAQKKEGQR